MHAQGKMDESNSTHIDAIKRADVRTAEDLDEVREYLLLYT